MHSFLFADALISFVVSLDIFPTILLCFFFFFLIFLTAKVNNALNYSMCLTL